MKTLKQHLKDSEERDEWVRRQILLKERIGERTFPPEATGKQKLKPTSQIIWKGEKEHLVELFIELEKKGWIDPPFNYSQTLKKVVENIYNLFDVTLTEGKKGKKPKDPFNSFYQTFKGENRIKISKDKKSKSFSDIKPNSRKSN